LKPDAIALIVMAKAPRPGLAKTRLIPALGAAGAARLAARLLEHTVHEALASGVGPLHLFATPGPDDAAFESLAARCPLALHAQGEGDLGARMQRAFERVLAEHGAALMIGTDAPALDRTRLQDAATALPTADAVFVPAHDGGYALIGLHRTAAWLFDGMPWSTPAVMATTRERAHTAGWHIAERPPVADIDEAADLVHLPPGWHADLVR
jgi:uncharacterized protein